MAHSLRFWLAIGLSSLIALSIATIVAILLGVLLPRLNAEVVSDNRNMGAAVSRQVDSFLDNAASEIESLGRDFAAADAAALSPARIRLQLDTLVNSLGPLEALYLVDAERRVADVGLPIERRKFRDELIGLDFSAREFIAQAQKNRQLAWSDTYLSLRGKIVVAVAIPWQSGDHGGTLVGELNLDYLSQHLAALGKVTEALPIIVDRRGHIVAHPEPGRALRQENLNQLALVKTGRSHPGTTERFELDQVDYIGSIFPTGAPGWHVLVAQPSERAFATVRSTLRSLAAGTLLSFVLALLAAALYGRRLTRRVAEFGRHVEAIAAGNYNAHLPASRAEELNNLADSMRRMAGAVLDREARLQDSEKRFRDVASISADWIWEVDNAGRYTFASESVRSLLGYAPEQIIGKTAFDLMPADLVPKIRAAFADIVRRGEPFRDLENVVLDAMGRRHVTLTSGAPVRDAAGQVVGYRGVDRDISERRRDEAALTLAASVFSASVEGICITDAEARIVSANPALSTITGYSSEEMVGKTPALFRSGRHDKEFYRAMWAQVKQVGSWRGEIWNRRKSGDVYPEWLSITAVKDASGAVTHYIGNFSDISERKRAEENIVFMAHHDALTRLPNRVLLDDRIRQAIAKSRRTGDHSAVLFLDLDRFKLINDTLGHDLGDRLLEQVAERLRAALRETETVARLGGDEFVVVIPEVAEIDRVAVVAQKLVETMTEPLAVAGHVLHVTTSIGIAVYPEDGEDAATLLRNADTAMYHAKENGRNNFQFFTKAMNAAVLERVSIENDLRLALERGEFRLFYQPQVDSRSGKVQGMEALIRWQHPTQGMVFPDRFIAIAEETGLIVPIGEWVLHEACAQARRWHDAGQSGLRIGVNLSARQFQAGGLRGQVVAALATSGIDPQTLELELTESMLMADPENAAKLLYQLAALGVRMAIDDFGTGYSSLAYLKRFPVTRLKIDRSFVRDLSSDPNDAAIVQAVVAMAGSLSMEVIAEGVETIEQLRYLEAHGCFAIQGYFFSRPKPAIEHDGFCFDMSLMA
ncbi:MAG TPA: EAL domain-containing protein [Rhodocyclaceae bacterium]|nr:EAL domain-containing protein [Rhodocyclaceae bacterium]